MGYAVLLLLGLLVIAPLAGLFQLSAIPGFASDSLVFWVELVDSGGDAGIQGAAMAGQAERLQRNRLDVPGLVVRKSHGRWRSLRRVREIGVQDGSDPAGGRIGGIAKPMAGAPQADAALRKVVRDFGRS